MELREVVPNGDPVTSEQYTFAAVCGPAQFGPEGESEDNTFARWTPSATLTMSVTNPALFGQFKVGQKFYVDFSTAS